MLIWQFLLFLLSEFMEIYLFSWFPVFSFYSVFWLFPVVQFNRVLKGNCNKHKKQNINAEDNLWINPRFKNIILLFFVLQEYYVYLKLALSLENVGDFDKTKLGLNSFTNLTSSDNWSLFIYFRWYFTCCSKKQFGLS